MSTKLLILVLCYQRLTKMLPLLTILSHLLTYIKATHYNNELVKFILLATDTQTEDYGCCSNIFERNVIINI